LSAAASTWLKAPGVVGFLLPRPLSFLANSLQFWGGVLVALVSQAGLSNGRFPPFTTDAGPSGLLFVLLWFGVQEGLVQQAKYQWNDLRDWERDQQLPMNRRRPTARQPLRVRSYGLLLARWGLGLGLAAWLSPALLGLVLLITALQIGYELAAKPRAARWPLLSLAIVALGAALKFGGGALAAGWSAPPAHLGFYAAAMFGLGLVYNSTFYRVEAAYLLAHGRPFQRGQSGYFLRYGRRWLKIGVLLGLAAWLALLLDLLWRGGLRFTWPLVAALGYLLVFLAFARANATTDYPTMCLLHFGRNFPRWRVLLRAYVQQPHSGLKLGQLVRLAGMLNTARFTAVRRAARRGRLLSG